jgi:hypothetical protein
MQTLDVGQIQQCDFGHMLRREDTREIRGYVRNPKNMIPFDVLNAKELMQKL